MSLGGSIRGVQLDQLGNRKKRAELVSRKPGLAEGGFADFLGRAATPIKVKEPFQPSGPREYVPSKRAPAPQPTVADDSPKGRKTLRPVSRPSPRNTGMRHVPAYDSGGLFTNSFQSKKRVIDERTGKLAIEKSSDEYDFHTLYGRTRQYGPKRQYSHGIFPSCHNYPPSRDSSGAIIDYSMKHNGGMFSSKPIRTEEVDIVPPSVAETRGVAKNSAVARQREAAALREAQAEARLLAESRRRPPPSSHSTVSGRSHAMNGRLATSSSRASSLAPSSSLPSLSRVSTARSRGPSTAASSRRDTSRCSTGTSASSWQATLESKERRLAELRAQVASLKASASHPGSAAGSVR